LRGQDHTERCTRHPPTIPSKKSEKKCLQNDESSDAQKSPKIARKRHENHTGYEKEIDATMIASIQLDVRFSTKP
jgi:hypothetical protein